MQYKCGRRADERNLVRDEICLLRRHGRPNCGVRISVERIRTPYFGVKPLLAALIVQRLRLGFRLMLRGRLLLRSAVVNGVRRESLP